MKKEKISFPDKILWSSLRTIAQEDINYAHHMGNERILVWADQIRNEFLKSIGWDEKYIFETAGVIVANHTIVYQSEGFLGDEILIDVGIDFLTEHSFDIVIRTRKKGAERNMIVLRTGIVCFNYAKREIQTIPDIFYQKLKEGV